MSVPARPRRLQLCSEDETDDVHLLNAVGRPGQQAIRQFLRKRGTTLRVQLNSKPATQQAGELRLDRLPPVLRTGKHLLTGAPADRKAGDTPFASDAEKKAIGALTAHTAGLAYSRRWAAHCTLCAQGRCLSAPSQPATAPR